MVSQICKSFDPVIVAFHIVESHAFYKVIDCQKRVTGIMSGKRPNVRDVLKRNRKWRAKLLVMIVCALTIVYVMDSDIVGVVIVVVIGTILTSLKNDIWLADDLPLKISSRMD